MLIIQDEAVAEQLRKIAEREHRSVDEVLKRLLLEHLAEPSADDIERKIKQLRSKAYVEARQYWQETGNTERLALTDAQLDEQFWLFDGDGIPRLKSERGTVYLPPGSGARMVEVSERLSIHTGELTNVAEFADDILNDEFADYLLKRTHNGADEDPD